MRQYTFGLALPSSQIVLLSVDFNAKYFQRHEFLVPGNFM